MGLRYNQVAGRGSSPQLAGRVAAVFYPSAVPGRLARPRKDRNMDSCDNLAALVQKAAAAADAAIGEQSWSRFLALLADAGRTLRELSEAGVEIPAEVAGALDVLGRRAYQGEAWRAGAGQAVGLLAPFRTKASQVDGPESPDGFNYLGSPTAV